MIFIVLIHLSLNLFSDRALADETHHAGCEARMTEALALLQTDFGLLSLAEEPSLADSSPTLAESPVELAVADPETILDILVGLELPQSILENRAQFEKERELARSVLLPKMAAIRRDLQLLAPTHTIDAKLELLAEFWDKATTRSDRQAVLAEMMRLFSIKDEQAYMRLIANGNHSPEMKTALYQALAKIFKFDPAWRPDLDRAARKAGILK